MDMANRKSDGRRKNGGSRPGSGRPKLPNPFMLTEGERVDLAKFCSEIGYDPVVRMIEIAENEDTTVRLQFEVHREVAKYLHPTLGRVNVEHSGKIEGDLSDKSVEELRRMAEGLRGE